MHRLARFSLGHRALTALVTVVIAVLGLVSLGGLKQELMPSVTFPQTTIIAVYPGASPEMVEKQVTIPVEDAALGVKGVTSVTSTSASGISSTMVELDFGTDMDKAMTDLRNAVTQAILPADVDPQIMSGSIDDAPAVMLAVSGGTDQTSLQTTVDDVLVPALKGLDGVRSVAVSGEPTAQVQVHVDMAAMTAAMVSPDALMTLLHDNGVRVPAGTVADGDQTLAVQVGTPITTLDELQSLPVPTLDGKTVPLSQVATVTDTQAAVTSFSRVDGEPSLGIEVYKTSDGNVVEVSGAVSDAIANLSDRLDAQDVRVSVVFDQAPYITRSINDLAEEGGLGLAFAVLVILLFLMSWRSTVVSALSIPLSLLTAFIVMRLTGYTLNIFTLAALTIAIGRVVDDSIVVIENISRHLSYGEKRVDAIRTAVREVAGAITSATLATVAVFAPIGFVSGFVGQMFRPFALTVVIAMLASLFVALTIIPVLAYWFLPAPATSDVDVQAVRDTAEAKERSGVWQRAYLPVLGWAVRRPVATVLIAVAVLGGTVAAATTLQTNMFSDSGQNTIGVTQTFEPGTSLAAQDDASRTVEQVILDTSGVETVQTTVGTTSTLVGGAMAQQASFWVTLDPDADTTATTDAVTEALTPLVGGLTTHIDVTSSESGMTSSTIDLVVVSDDPTTLNEAADLVEASVDGIDGVTKVTSSRTADQPVVQVTVDRAAADTAGLSEVAVAQTVAGLLNDLNLGQVDLGDGPQDVVLHLQDAPVDLDALRAATLTTPNGSVALDDVADVERVTMPAVITRTDGQRTVTISVTPDSDELGSVSGQLATTTADLDLPAGATVTVGGAASDQASAFNDLGMAMLAAIFVVFIVMVAALSSIGQALILLVSIPFAATGALLGLLVTDIPLGVPALVGLLMLVGIVVSNAIVLIDLINQYRAAGRSIHEAVTEGSRQRLRPIVMTAAATIFALSPMAVGFTGGGGFIAQPLAVVVIGGLLSSTLLTLVVVPVLYVLTQRSAERRAARRAERTAAREALTPENLNV